MEDAKQAEFSSWAIVDVLGHQRYVGYVRTEAYGQAVMFRIDVPELPEREYKLEAPEYVAHSWTPAGATVKRAATPGYTKLIGAGSIYSISPCDEPAAMKAVEATQRAELKVIALPENHKALAAPDDDEDDGEEDDDDDDDDLDVVDYSTHVPY